MKQLSTNQINIIDSYWSPRLVINATRAIFHQWEQLEKSGCIDNFRIVIGEKEGFREGWVFADSDAYKWLEAAARISTDHPDPKLKNLMDELIRLLARTQMEDGYIYTFNQFHFPGQRWVNMQIEHELYCHGHLIEAGISHYESTGEHGALEIAIKAADLLVRSFLHGPAEQTDGHEEVELALLRLHTLTGNLQYLELARHFIEVRGRIRFYALQYQNENASYAARKVSVSKKRAEYAASHPEYAVSKIPPDNESKEPPFSKLRRKLDGWSGRYTQQHVPIRKQTVPVGHAVRYGYFQTAISMLYRLQGDASLLPALQQSWNHLVTRRMSVTGGVGALPGNEGFGADYELNPEYAYNETCAALASLFWNWEMALATGEARYSDLFEWQLYNAAAVGMGLEGESYLYNNPLCVHGGITRRAWYSVPCCPSNISRTWAGLGKFIYSYAEQNLGKVPISSVWIHQYIGSQTSPTDGFPARISLESEFPYNGTVTIRITPVDASKLTLYLRLPSWSQPDERYGQKSAGCSIRVNGEEPRIQATRRAHDIITPSNLERTAQGYDPRLGSFIQLTRSWQPGDVITLIFDMPITLRRAHPKVKNHAGKVALTRGPLVYCLESIDNPGVDIFTTTLMPGTLVAQQQESGLGRITVLKAISNSGQPLIFIPYHLWGNRGASQMVVWVNE